MVGTKARNAGSGFRQRGPQLMASMSPTVPALRPAAAPAKPKAYMAEPAVMRRPAPAGSAPYPTAATAKPALPESALSPQLTSNTAGLATKRDAAGNRINPLTGKPFGGGAPVTSGKQVAQSNIASMGLKGAIADYQKRSEAAKSAKFQSGFAKAAATPKTMPMSAPTGTPGSYAKAAGLPAKPKAPASMDFTVPPTSNAQMIGAPTTSPAAPVSEFAKLTTPRPAPSAPAPLPSPVTVQASAPAPKRTPSFTTAQSRIAAKDSQANAFRQKKKAEFDQAYNAQPNLPFAAKDSVANSAYKSARPFLSGKSY